MSSTITAVAATRASATVTLNPTHTYVPDKNGHVPPDDPRAFYLYYPNFDAAIAFSAMFCLLTIVHLAQAISYRKVNTLCVGPKAVLRDCLDFKAKTDYL